MVYRMLIRGLAGLSDAAGLPWLLSSSGHKSSKVYPSSSIADNMSLKFVRKLQNTNP